MAQLPQNGERRGQGAGQSDDRRYRSASHIHRMHVAQDNCLWVVSIVALSTGFCAQLYWLSNILSQSYLTLKIVEDITTYCTHVPREKRVLQRLFVFDGIPTQPFFLGGCHEGHWRRGRRCILLVQSAWPPIRFEEHGSFCNDFPM